MRPLGLCAALLCLLLLSLSYAVADKRVPGHSLQESIDRAGAGSTLTLAPGVYYGPATINKALTIDGKDGATVNGQNNGTVITVKANGVKITNLRIINSGERYDLLDSAVALIDSSNCEVLNNRVENCLFGIYLQNSHNNLVKGNKISSKHYEPGLRGDGIWAWWSDSNNFIDNEIRNSRDFVIWYSMGNNIEGNKVIDCRYSLHFMFSDNNYVSNNYFENNSVGVYNMYSNGIVIENNVIVRSLGATGMGIGLKEASDTIVKGNRILYSSRGIGVDESPFEPDAKDYFINNEIVFNNEAVAFVTDGTRVNNIFEGNSFKSNIQDVTVSGTRGVAKGFWKRNYWDSYQGFDQNRDYIGDTPYRYYIYGGQLWLNNPALQFFRGSVVMTFLEFLQRLAPFSEPELALVDEEPLWRPTKTRWTEEEAVKRELAVRMAGSKLMELRRGTKGQIPMPSFEVRSKMPEN